MAKKGIINNIKRKLCVLLSMVLLVCTAGLVFVACNDDSSSDYTDKSYSHEWSDEATLKNGSFEFGSDDLEDKEFPQSSSVDSWSFSTDNSAQSSLVSSGIIRTNDDSWTQLISNLYDDTDFRAYAQKKWDFSSTAEKTDAIEKITNGLQNPKTPVDSKGDKVYMINNYPSVSSLGGIGVGTAQKLTSSTTITLTPASYGKITVYVKTANLAHNGQSTEIGANIRIANTVGSTSQAEYRINGINTENGTTTVDANGWAKYEIYIKADGFINNSVVVSVGLGYGSGSSTSAKYYCEGTAFFDDITFEEVEESEFNEASMDVVKYETSAKDHIEKSASSQVFYFSMDIDDSLKTYAPEYFKKATTEAVGSFVQKFSDSQGSLTKVANSGENACKYSSNTEIYKVDVANTSYTLNFGSKTSPFGTLAPETYNQVTFYLKNNLSEFDVNGISVLVYDVYSKNSSTPIEKAGEIITPTFEEEGEWVKVSFNVTNNFPEKNIDNKFNGDVRSYFFKVIIGPTDPSSTAQKNAYANGSVLMTFPYVAEGFTYNYNRTDYIGENKQTYSSYKDTINAGTMVTSYTVSEALPENRTENNSYYSLFLSVADKKFALYNGLDADYSDDTQEDSYDLTTSPSNIGSILSNPADPDGFTGVSYDHAYIKGDSTNFSVNDRSGNGTAQGNAGLVNTKYLSSYTNGTSIASALGHNSSTARQPLMIYNSALDSYGYIGEELTVSANNTLNVSIRVRVVGDANAYVYLVDTSKAKKNVMSITVPVNTDGTNYLDSDKVTTYTKELAFKVDSSMMRTDEDGWVTLNFYIAAGNKTKTLRLELWNGSRDGVNKSTGYVFFDNIYTSGSFSEPSTDNYREQFTTAGILLNASIYDKNSDLKDSALLHKRELDETEIKYNSDDSRKNSAVTYDAKYIFAQSKTTIYAVYNTLEYDSVDPYLSETTDDDASSGCAAETDPSTFWLSFSTITLGVALAVAIIALIVKGVVARRKANKNDAKSHYNVSSRYKQKKDKKDKPNEAIVDNTENNDNTVDDATETENVTEEVANETTENATEASSEESVNIYGDVQDFGSDDENK